MEHYHFVTQRRNSGGRRNLTYLLLLLGLGQGMSMVRDIPGLGKREYSFCEYLRLLEICEYSREYSMSR